MVRTKSIKALKKDLKFVESLTGGRRRKARRAHGFGPDLKQQAINMAKSQAVSQLRKYPQIKGPLIQLKNDPVYQSVVKDPSKIKQLIDKINVYVDKVKLVAPEVIIVQKVINMIISKLKPEESVPIIDGFINQIVAN